MPIDNYDDSIHTAAQCNNARLQDDLNTEAF